VIRLGDLGIAKQLTSTQDLALTCLGSPYYMSPELMASRPYTYASDVWALGCVLYEVAARQTPFFAPALAQLVGLILRAGAEFLHLGAVV
jgi:NIMA (never in mitosis gene a)-related kinase